MAEAKIPKAFISYSWDDDAHKKWVKDFSARLRTDGVDVTLDNGQLIQAGNCQSLWNDLFVRMIMF